MIAIVKYRFFALVLHVLVWCIVLFFPYFISSAANQYKIGPLPGLYLTLSGIIHIGIFYTNALLLYPRFLNRAYWLLYIGCVVLMVLLSVWLKFCLLAWWFPDAVQAVRPHVLFPSVLVFIVSLLYSITIDKIRTEKLQQAHQARQWEMELKFLRSQMSPHFLFNVLTNLVLLARKKPDQLEASLLMLSDLMRYMLFDAKKRISLQQEVQYLESYIMLQKLRFGQDVSVTFNVALPGSAIDYGIEPLLLIPFVENAFKHGTGSGDEPFIAIDLIVEEKALSFEVKNRLDADVVTGKDEAPGIGLENVRARLALLYPGRHTLEIRTDDGVFHVHLTLNLLS